MTWVFLVLGLIIGWLLYQLADTFFWRDRRICTDLERDLQNSVVQLEGQQATLNERISVLDTEASKVPDLEASLQAREARVGALTGDLEARDAEINGFNMRVGDLETANASLNGQIGELEADLASRDLELAGLRTKLGGLEADLNGRNSQIEGLNTQLSDLNVQLGDRDAEIQRLNGQVGSVDSELKGWGLGALAAGGLMALRERFSGMRADLSAKDEELDSLQVNVEDTSVKLGTLTADLDSKNAELADLNAQIDGLNLDLQAKESELADLNLQLGNLQADLGNRDVELGELRGQLADVDAELSGLNLDADAGMAAAGTGLGLAGLISWLRSRKDSLETDVSDRDGQILALNAQVETDAQTFELERVGHNQRIGELEAQLATLEAKDVELSSLNAQLGDLNADIEARDAQISGLNVDLETKESELADLNLQLGNLQADLGNRDVELGELRGQLADVDAELSGLNIDADAGVATAGAGLGLAGLIGWLRSRKDSLEGDVSDRDSQILALNAQVETDAQTFEVERTGYSQRIGELEAQLAALEAKDVEIDALNARVAGLNADIEVRDSRIGELDAELASVQSELDGLDIDADAQANLNVGTAAGAGLGLAGLVGWLRNRNSSLETGTMERDNQILALNAQVETDAQAFEVDRGRYGQRISDLEALLAEREATIGVLQANVAPDDLTRVWSIGPKIAAALNDNGIKTYPQLAETDDDAITAILESSGVNYRLAGPTVRATWQEQAELLAAGNMDELKLRQAQFKRSGGGLGKVWGIGSKVTGLLAAVGVTNYTELATSSTAEIGDALHAAKGYYPGMSNAEIHQSWVRQASMAANSQWTPLKNYQARFRRGRVVAADDLKRIWGIGPKIEEILNAKGIHTFNKLAETSLTQIDEILDAAGPRFNVMASEALRINWKHQARLASIGDWDAFQALHDKLTWENVQDNDEEDGQDE